MEADDEADDLDDETALEMIRATAAMAGWASQLRFERKRGFRLQALSLATNEVPPGREKAVERFLCETVPTLDLASSPCGLC